MKTKELAALIASGKVERIALRRTWGKLAGDSAAQMTLWRMFADGEEAGELESARGGVRWFKTLDAALVAVRGVGWTGLVTIEEDTAA